MQDSENRPRSIEEVWERMAADARRSRADSETEEYFLGIFDGCMAGLAVLSAYLGKMKEYAELCYELGDIPWVSEGVGVCEDSSSR